MWEKMAERVMLKTKVSNTAKSKTAVKAKKAASKMAIDISQGNDSEPIYPIDSTINAKIAFLQADIALLAVDAVVCNTDQNMTTYQSRRLALVC